MDNEIFEKEVSKEVSFSKTIKETRNCWELKNTFLTISRKTNNVMITIKNKNATAYFNIDKEQFVEVIKGMQDIAR